METRNQVQFDLKYLRLYLTKRKSEQQTSENNENSNFYSLFNISEQI